MIFYEGEKIYRSLKFNNKNVYGLRRAIKIGGQKKGLCVCQSIYKIHLESLLNSRKKGGENLIKWEFKALINFQAHPFKLLF